MKNLMNLALVVIMTYWSSPASASDLGPGMKSSAEGASQETQAQPGPKGDDLFPWPWGTECPFPWQEINGTYVVHSAEPTPYRGHFMVFRVLKNKSANSNHLRVGHYDRRGWMLAEGYGYSENDQRIVRAVLKPVSARAGGESFVMVRSYLKDQSVGLAAGCKGEQVTAITFCTIKDSGCYQDSNHILEKVR